MKFKKDNIIIISTLFLICVLIFCLNIANYPFIDTDETKLVSIAKSMLNNKDWFNIKYEGENFFNFSPLYFWLINLSRLIFEQISIESVRFPVSLTVLVCVLSIFFALNQILSKTHAFIISLIFLSSLGIIVFSRLATIDIFFVAFSVIALLFGYLAIFSEKRKAIFLFFMYIFCAISVLTSGLFGLIPLLAVIFIYIFSGSFKNLLKPLNFLPGVFSFLVIVLPWYILTVSKYGYSFVYEFLNSYNLFKYSGFKQFSITLVLFILAFSPWIFSFIWIFGYKMKSIFSSMISYFKNNSKKNLKEKWDKLQTIDKFISINTIVFIISLMFACLYGEKYTFLILYLIFPAACIIGHYWYEYIFELKHQKSIFFATIIPNLIMIICSLTGLFGHNIINKWLFEGLNHLIIPLIIIFFVIPVISIFAVMLKGKKVAFSSNILLMICLSFVITPNIFNFLVINNGENDLITFAIDAKKEKNSLIAYIPSRKYSLEYYYDKPVKYFFEFNIDNLKKILENNQDTYVVIEIKNMLEVDEKIKNYTLVNSGKRYCIIKYEEKEKELEEQILEQMEEKGIDEENIN